LKQDLGSLAYDQSRKKCLDFTYTLRDKKQLCKLDSNPKVILVGSGMYPYSMFDLHKRNPEIKQIGIEIDE
jgi:tRNA G46 methylase TrmB